MRAELETKLNMPIVYLGKWSQRSEELKRVYRERRKGNQRCIIKLVNWCPISPGPSEEWPDYTNRVCKERRVKVFSGDSILHLPDMAPAPLHHTQTPLGACTGELSQFTQAPCATASQKWQARHATKVRGLIPSQKEKSHIYLLLLTSQSTSICLPKLLSIIQFKVLTRTSMIKNILKNLLILGQMTQILCGLRFSFMKS